MTTHTESRAQQLWASFAGMFGGEALTRKYGANIPREWLDLVGQLKDFELSRGIRRMAASGAEHVPTLPKFKRWCREVANDDLDRPASRPLPQLPSNLVAQDAWDVAASRHLVHYLFTRLGRNPRAFGPIVPGQNNGSPEQERCTAILVKWKKRWAQAMREAAFNNQVDSQDQRELWDSHMEMAEAEIIESMEAPAAEHDARVAA